jgi:hypothetical protein
MRQVSNWVSGRVFAQDLVPVFLSKCKLELGGVSLVTELLSAATDSFLCNRRCTQSTQTSSLSTLMVRESFSYSSAEYTVPSQPPIMHHFPLDP